MCTVFSKYTITRRPTWWYLRTILKVFGTSVKRSHRGSRKGPVVTTFLNGRVTTNRVSWDPTYADKGLSTSTWYYDDIYRLYTTSKGMLKEVESDYL